MSHRDASLPTESQVVPLKRNTELVNSRMAMGWQNLHFTVSAYVYYRFLLLFNLRNIRSTIGTMIPRYVPVALVNVHRPNFF